MFFILSKTIPFLLQPTSIVLILWLSYYIFRKWKLRKYLLFSSLFLFVIFTNDFLANYLLLRFQKAPVTTNNLEKKTYAVLLTGMTHTLMSPKEKVYFNQNADRILQSMQLYYNNKFDTLIISGGGATALRDNIREAKILQAYLNSVDFPQQKLLIEDSSRNTYESALFLSPKLSGKEVILISSASHLPRASAVFNKQMINTQCYPTVYYTNNTMITPSMFLPSTEAIIKWNILTKELLGLLAYKAAGYL